MWSATCAVVIRNLRLLRRQRSLLVQPIVLPLAVMLLAAFIFGGGGQGDAYPIGLVNDAKTQEGDRMEETIRNLRSNISPYFQVIVTDLEEAKSMVEQGRLQMVIHIPASFEHRKQLDIYTYNINSDAMKNLRLRLEYAMNEIGVSQGHLPVQVSMKLEKPNDVWRSAFIGGSSVLLSLFFGAALIAANLFAFERENRTRKEILLTPVGTLAAGWGTVITALAASILTSLPTLLTAVSLFRLEVPLARWIWLYVHMIPVMIACAGLGIWIASRLKRYRTIQPVIVLTGMATFFIGGGFISVVVLPPAAKAFAEWWIFSRIFEWFNPVMHQFAEGFTTEQYVWILTSALAGLMMMIMTYYAERKQPLDGGQ